MGEAEFPRMPLHSQFVYRYAGAVYSVVQFKDENEDLGVFDEMIDDVSKLAKPHKDTVLHEVIRVVGMRINEYAVYDAPDYFAEDARDMLSAARIRIPKWLTEETLGRGEPDYRSALWDLVDKAFEAVVPSIFYMLFSDRTFLQFFQGRLAEKIATVKRTDYPLYLQRDGVLKRQRPPAWLNKAVFYRDRGICQKCYRNLSGLDQPMAHIHLDHIVPLAASGSNDPTNFQLLCGRCNIQKGAKRTAVMPTFTPYW